MPRWRVPLIGVIVRVAAGAWLWHGKQPATGADAFRLVTVTRGDLHATVTATGTVEPEEVVDVGAQVVGMIRELGRDPRDRTRPIDYGSMVEEGTFLAQIDDTLYRAQVDQVRANAQRARADLLQMHAKLRRTEHDWKRAKELRKSGDISAADHDLALADYDTARSALAVGEAAVVQAEAALRQAEINLGYTTIRSPVKG